MAIFTAPPTQLPEYCTSATPVIDQISGQPNLTEPTQSIKDNGDTPFGTRPKRGFANWRDHYSYKQHEWSKNSFYPEVTSRINDFELLIGNEGRVYTSDYSFSADGNSDVLNIVSTGTKKVGCIMINPGDPNDTVIVPTLPASTKKAGVAWTSSLSAGGRVDGSINADMWLYCYAIAKDLGLPSQDINYTFDDSVLGTNTSSLMQSEGYQYKKFLFAFPFMNGLVGGPNSNPIIPGFDYVNDWVLWHELLSTQTLNFTATGTKTVNSLSIFAHNGTTTIQKFPEISTLVKYNIALTQDRGVLFYPGDYLSNYNVAIELQEYSGNTSFELPNTLLSRFSLKRFGLNDTNIIITNHGYKNPLRDMWWI